MHSFYKQLSLLSASALSARAGSRGHRRTSRDWRKAALVAASARPLSLKDGVATAELGLHRLHAIQQLPVPVAKLLEP